MNKWPSLVLKQFCTVSVVITVYSEDYAEDGAPIVILEKEAKCNYQASSKTIINDKSQQVELSGVCYFHEDIAPDVAEITNGEIEIMGEKRRIYKGSKGRNPDGSVNFVKIEVI